MSKVYFFITQLGIDQTLGGKQKLFTFPLNFVQQLVFTRLEATVSIGKVEILLIFPVQHISLYKYCVVTYQHCPT